MQRRPLLAWCVLAVCLVAVRPGCAAETFDLAMDDATWPEVAEQLSRVSGQPVILDHRLSGSVKMRIRFENVSLAEAVEQLALLAKTAVAPLPDGGFLIYLPAHAGRAMTTERASIPVRRAKASELATWLGGRSVNGQGTSREAAPEIVRPPASPAFELPEGIVEVVGFDLISALVVKGTPQGIAALRELVAMLDQPPLAIGLKLRMVVLRPGAAARLQAPWAELAQGGAALKVTRREAEALVTAVVRDNLAKVTNVPLSTLNGQPTEWAYHPAGGGAEVAHQALVIVPRLLGEEPDRSFAVAVALQRRSPAREAPYGTPRGEVILKVTLRVQPGEVVATRLDGHDGEPVLVLVEPRELRE